MSIKKSSAIIKKDNINIFIILKTILPTAWLKFITSNVIEKPIVTQQTIKTTTVSIAVSIRDYDEDINPMALGVINNTERSNKFLVNETVKLDNNITINAKLTTCIDKENIHNEKTNHKDIYYKIIVYKSSTGEFVTERIFRTKEMESSNSIPLDSDEKYTFIAISLNSSKSQKGISHTFANTNLFQAEFTAKGDVDLLFDKKEVFISGNTQRININLKHKFNQITTILDSNNYNINNPVEISLLSLTDRAHIKFGDEIIYKTGILKNTPLILEKEDNNQFLITQPQVFNTVSGVSALFISKLIVNSTTLINTRIIMNAFLKQGAKYYLIISLKEE